MTKILIAGGAGFVGAHLTHRLCGLGFDVVVLDALRPYALPKQGRDRELRNALIANATVLRVDLLDFEKLISCLEAHQPSIVINLAADPIVASANLNPLRCENDIVESTRNLVHALAATGSVQRLVQVSSSMVYGDFKDGRADETSPTEPVNAYGRMKLAAENLVRDLSARGEMEAVIVRPMAVYGPGDSYDRVIPIFCANCVAEKPLTLRAAANARIDFSYVSDISEGLILAALEPAASGETFNLSYGEARTLLDVVAALSVHFPDLRYDIVPADGPVQPHRGTLDISKAARLLGYRPTIPLEAGIDRCIAFLRRPDQVSRLVEVERGRSAGSGTVM